MNLIKSVSRLSIYVVANEKLPPLSVNGILKMLEEDEE